MRVRLCTIAAVLAAAPAVAHELRAVASAPHAPTAAMTDILRWTSAFRCRALIGT